MGEVNVFVSSQSVDGARAASLIDGLRRAHVRVNHSPRNPLDGQDPRWEDWYQAGLPAAVGRCNVFVAVIDRGWDSSTWMGCEAEMATKAGLPLLYWNPDRVRVTAPGMVPYLREQLPDTLNDALALLLRRGMSGDIA
jgi:hypothetical protein